jgi:hypothetical protein
MTLSSMSDAESTSNANRCVRFGLKCNASLQGRCRKSGPECDGCLHEVTGKILRQTDRQTDRQTEKLQFVRTSADTDTDTDMIHGREQSHAAVFVARRAEIVGGQSYQYCQYVA